MAVDDLEKLRVIGQGTFGEVWLVKHTATDRFLALKVRPWPSSSPHRARHGTSTEHALH